MIFLSEIFKHNITFAHPTLHDVKTRKS